MKKRIVIVAGILILIFVVTAIMNGEKKTKITVDNGQEYWISHEKRDVWLETYPHNIIRLYDKELNFLIEFDVKGEEIQEIEIKYDGTVDNWDFYMMSVLTEYESREWMWKEREDDIFGGMDLSFYIRTISEAEAVDNVFEEMKGYALKKIIEGEYEWLYSYGDILISEGHTELIDIVKNIIEDRTYSPEYVKEYEFYRVCEEVLHTYS